MANETITFACPACGIRLTVPGNLAGVIGPCPTCRTQIQAPFPAAPPAAAGPPVVQAARMPVLATPEYQAPPVLQPEPALSVSHAAVRPEPRQLPQRASNGEPVSKPMPVPMGGGRSGSAAPPPGRHPRARSRFGRFVMLAGFLLGATALIFGVASVLRNQTKGDLLKNTAQAPAETILTRSAVAPEPAIERLPSLPVTAPEQPSIVQPVPDLPEGLEAKSPNDYAEEALAKFLAAKTLAERLPLLETKTPGPELAASALAGPLPLASHTAEAVENNPVEQVADFYHKVEFDAGENRKKAQTILVRIRGSSPAKIVTDPFLDTYGGRLAAFAKAPSDKSGVFQVIVWPLASCFDERVPDREKKLTLKLLPQEDSKEIAMAYFSRQSKIAEMLEDGTYSLSYGRAKACTVVLRWNMEENPDMPYLEAIELKRLDWNP